jgi:predicted helicase
VRGEERGLLSNARCLGEGIDVPTPWGRVHRPAPL